MEEVTMKIKKPYTLGKLSSRHIFIFCTILKKIGFKEIKNCINTDDIAAMVDGKEVNIEKIGLNIVMEIASVIISNMESCKDSIYQLLSDLSGMSKEEIDNLDMDIFINMIIDVFKKDEFKVFFKVASKLFN